MTWLRIQDQRLLGGLLGGLVLLSWSALWLWGNSPYGHYMMHGGRPVHLHGTGAAILFPVLFIAGWTLMTIAMMLPTSTPLILLFARVVSGRSNTNSLIAMLISGYLAAWVGFGVIVHVLSRAVYAGMDRVPWIAERPWILGASILAIAGAYQFSSLKYACLDKCRSPMMFLMEHWGSGQTARQALRLGFDHGAFCVGCCWSLMLLMFVVGSGSLGWMLALGVVMAAEKNLPWGRKLSAPLGVLLLMCAVLVVLNYGRI
jgi:predicted metal-binding membrane protein